MRCFGVIGAEEAEVARLKEAMTDAVIERAAGMDFYKGTLNGQPSVVVRCGIGKVSAAVCTQILKDHYDVDAIVNTGAAGSLDAEINIGDVVLSTDLVQHDYDVTGLGYKKGQIPELPVFSFQADERLRRLAKEVCREVNPDIQVFEGRIASGDQFISGGEMKAAIVSEFHALAAEMEGAAMAQAAYLNDVPFLVVRSISDKADGSAEMDYPTFQQIACEHSVRLVEALAGRLAQNGV